MSLMQELCRVYNAKPVAIECALRHGQITIDGYIIREQHLKRWTPDQLKGRMAMLLGRQVRLYG